MCSATLKSLRSLQVLPKIIQCLTGNHWMYEARHDAHQLPKKRRVKHHTKENCAEDQQTQISMGVGRLLRQRFGTGGSGHSWKIRQGVLGTLQEDSAWGVGTLLEDSARRVGTLLEDSAGGGRDTPGRFGRGVGLLAALWRHAPPLSHKRFGRMNAVLQLSRQRFGSTGAAPLPCRCCSTNVLAGDRRFSAIVLPALWRDRRCPAVVMAAGQPLSHENAGGTAV
jgi:hypothetical protein